MENAKITFLGAAKTVTGSATLIEFGHYKLLVDCGLFQGPKELRNKNWDLFSPQLAKSIDAIVLTHAHVDHSGLIPKIYQLGFRGNIYTTKSTLELSKILLPDSAYLQEEDVKRFNKTDRESFHGPLYSVKEANESLKLFKSILRNQWVELTKGLSVRFMRAGHILGSSFIQISVSHGNGVHIICFSGDLGNGRQNVIKGPEDLSESDDLVLESTYGDRRQSRNSSLDELKNCILEVFEHKSALVIPSFAVGRTQEILYLIKELEDKKLIPQIPVFLDSPMALEATQLYLQDNEDLKLSLQNDSLTLPLSPQLFRPVKKVEDSVQLTRESGPLIIISAAGMLTGGRILYHLKSRLQNKNNIVLFVGYQAENTKGRLLQNGLQSIRIHKENIHVKAKIKTIDSLSAHADSDDLIQWVSRMNKKPKRIFLNHGEPSALNALQYRLLHELGIHVEIPSPNSSYPLL